METRVYPTDCTSAYCGKTECPKDCPGLAALNAFKAWREATKAVRTDPIWCPSVWTAQKPDERKPS